MKIRKGNTVVTPERRNTHSTSLLDVAFYCSTNIINEKV